MLNQLKKIFLAQDTKLQFGRFLLKYLSFLFVVLLFFRLIFYFAFKNTDDLNLILNSLYLGIKFDIRLCSLLGIFLLILNFIPRKIYKNLKILKNIKVYLLGIISFLILYLYFVDIGHYAYLQKRLHISMIDNFENPDIAFKMMFETYPVFLIVLGFFSIFIPIFLINKKTIIEFINTDSRGPKKEFQVRFISFFILSALFYGKLSYYPLRWSEAYFSPSNFISQWSLNPVLNFIETMKFKTENYNLEKTKSLFPLVRDFLNISKENDTLNFQRSIDGDFKDRPNIVIVQMESLASNKTSIFNNQLDPTPYTKKIADQSLLFKKFFTPTEATARGVWAALTGLADIASKKSSSRNPLVIDQRVIMDQFTGYEKYYFLGGSASWGNIRSLFGKNIENIKIYEEGSYQNEKRIDVWGISDLDLFKKAFKISSERNKPYIAYIQSAGFHRPYTIPEDNDGFKIEKKFNLKQVRENGFTSVEEYNSMRFQDHALGKLFEIIKKSPEYENTMIVIFGDHGIPVVDKSVNMKPGYYKHRLALHHVPLIIHYPKKIKPKSDIKTLGSLVDLFPTIAGILDMPYQTKTFGRDLLKERKQNYAFLFSWHSPFTIGLVGENFYYEKQAGMDHLYDYESLKPMKDLKLEAKEKYQEMKDITHAIYETTKYLRFKNKN